MFSSKSSILQFRGRTSYKQAPFYRWVFRVDCVPTGLGSGEEDAGTVFSTWGHRPGTWWKCKFTDLWKGDPRLGPGLCSTSPPEILNVESLWSTSSWFREVCSLSERSFHRSSFLLPLAHLCTLGCAVGMTAASSGHRRVAVHSGASQGSSLVLLCTRLRWALRTTLSPPGAQTPPGETGWGHLQNIVCTFSNCYQ